ncbi:uncharacterized protein LOC658222 [Tribolium castaneum]|uniref:Uncharacterized protein n=1 Tax=Tribolium castaneum TaxID=7070 RepID=D6WX10_TRICA|nr:PREDICTED: uncharacterized protein LOC658222 [Tribolium castaneum]XP_976275.1 PREDICTED: uncharacterized protein LOC658222 [Tribolium castaneum]EFA08062.1 hypothetical protein TcasGA2_TC005658 [Tribolium castaneum]|eukprot:XP_015838296.1 PREDICTED: uncharacterized protein LOC658222 [Tribolium castaneum]
MAINFDRWTILKLLEVASTIACLAFKRVTDDEASRLFLYLQKLSREWRILNNVTWDNVGAAVADTTYGGYLIITTALFIGRLTGELPTQKRITEFVLLGVGTLLFIILGSLEFAALDSVPEDLVDNAAVIGTLTLVTAALFLLDMGGPKAKKNNQQSQTPPRSVSKPQESKTTAQQVYEIEKDVENEKKQMKGLEETPKNGHLGNGFKLGDANGRYRDSMYKKIKDEKPKSFDIYGKDMHKDSDTDEPDDIPPKMEEHSPVWSKIRKGQYGKYDILSPSYLYKEKPESEPERPPSSPGDPGYVQYTAQHWGETVQKTPRHSPTQV